MGYSDIIYYYMKNAKALILSSLWEDPGFVLIESALCNLSIISSDCNNGPREFLNNGDGGFLFESNKKNALKNKILEFIDSTNKTYSKKIYAKKNSLKYTMFRHSKKFVNILSF
jgi:glycosyltransferase involved in cell wall biosynthesis